MAELSAVAQASTVSLLDYGAGNVRSVRCVNVRQGPLVRSRPWLVTALLRTLCRNAIRRLGYNVEDISSPESIRSARVLVFPGVGSFGNAMKILKDRNLLEPLRNYIRAGRPFFGICLGMQTLFDGSDETPDVEVGASESGGCVWRMLDLCSIQCNSMRAFSGTGHHSRCRGAFPERHERRRCGLHHRAPHWLERPPVPRESRVMCA